MAMTVAKRTDMTGASTIDDTVTASFSANIESGQIVCSVVNKDKWSQNKDQVRQDFADFLETVYKQDTE